MPNIGNASDVARARGQVSFKCEDVEVLLPLGTGLSAPAADSSWPCEGAPCHSGLRSLGRLTLHPSHQKPRKEEVAMVKLTLRYARYSLTILASIGFRIALN